MKQSSLVILSLLLLLSVAIAKSGLSHKARAHKAARHLIRDDEDEVEAPIDESNAGQSNSDSQSDKVHLLNPLRHKYEPISESDNESNDDLDLRVVVLKNDAIDENAKGTDYTELCQLKQGYVNLVTNYQVSHLDSPNYGADNTPVLTIRRVFAVLNKQTLSLFENSNVNSLLKTVNVQQLGTNYFPERWSIANCFQTMNRNVDNQEIGEHPWIDVKEPVDDALVAFCFENQSKQEQWATALRTFQHCEVKEIVVNQKISHVVDQEINEIERVEAEEVARVQEEALQHQAHDEDLVQADRQEQDEIDSELQQISDDLKLERAKEATRKRNMEDEAIRIEEQTEKLEKERECLERMLREREHEEQNQEQLEIQEIEKDKQESLLKKAANILIQVKREEGDKLEAQHQQYKEDQTRKQEEIKEDMVRKTLLAELNLPFDVCVDVTNDNREQTFRDVCGQYAAQNPSNPELATKCLSNSGFCGACCEMHVGLNYITKRQSCDAECQHAVDSLAAVEEESSDCSDEDSVVSLTDELEAAADSELTGDAEEEEGEQEEEELEEEDDAETSLDEEELTLEDEEEPVAAGPVEVRKKKKSNKKSSKNHRRRRFLRKLRR